MHSSKLLFQIPQQPRIDSKMEYDWRVILASVDCIKKIILKLDTEAKVGSEGVQFILSQFSHSEIADNPLSLLDTLVLYLFHMHRVDWYSSRWVRGANKLTLRKERGVRVSDGDEEASVEAALVELRKRTDQFLQVQGVTVHNNQNYVMIIGMVVYSSAYMWLNLYVYRASS